MDWTGSHILAAIALVLAVFSGGVLLFPNPDGRLAPGFGAVSVILLSVAILIMGKPG